MFVDFVELRVIWWEPFWMIIFFLACIICKCIQQLTRGQVIIRARHAFGQALHMQLRKFGYPSTGEILWVSWWYICLSVHLHHTETNVKGLNYFLVSVSATWYCTSLLWSIGCCQNMLSTNQYDMTINYRRCRPIEVTCMCWQVTSFQLTTGSTPSGFLYNGYKLFI